VGRPEQRHHLDHPVRIELVERDVDEVIEQLETLNERLGRMLWAMVGLMVSVTTAAVLLAINIAVASQ
jgi:hypothetical protein